jgi:hypothetical protein
MPGGDGTGPMGQGPMTGRAAGLCAGYPHPGYAAPGFGRGYGRGRILGFGRGFWRRGSRFWIRDYIGTPYNQLSTNDEKTYLEQMVNNLKDELKAVKDRLQEISKEKKEK